MYLPRVRNSFRIVLYSHDTMGLGHLRRNLVIAGALARSRRDADILLIAGVTAAGAFSMPPGVDCLTLPALYKEGDGRYRARALSLSLRELTALRSRIIATAVDAFAPDLFIADGVPRGAGGELEDALQRLRARPHTRCVLGLRDILDEPAAVRFEWQSRRNHDGIDEYYDEVWVYGDRSFYDPVAEYQFDAATAAKVRFTGYFDRTPVADAPAPHDPHSPSLAELNLPPGKLVVCMVGGGQDGVALAQSFAAMELPAGCNAVIVTGPYISRDVLADLRRRRGGDARWRILEFHREPSVLLRSAHAVVTMAGYNTVCEVLSFDIPVLLVPRVTPRREQALRAQRLSERGLADVCPPSQLTPEVIRAWLTGSRTRRPRARACLDFGGLERLPRLAADLRRAAVDGAVVG